MTWKKYQDGDPVEDGAYWVYPADSRRHLPVLFSKGHWKNCLQGYLTRITWIAIYKIEQPQPPNIHEL